MTTIAYHHDSKVIAVDSRMTRGDQISTDSANKIVRKSGVIFVVSGDSQDIDKLIECYESKQGVGKQLHASAFVIEDGNVFYFATWDDFELTLEKQVDNHAIGSGSIYAIAAMDFGCSADKAVKYAMTRDVFTGGKIRSIKIK